MAWAGSAAAQVISLTLGRCLGSLLSRFTSGSSAEQAEKGQQRLSVQGHGDMRGVTPELPQVGAV